MVGNRIWSILCPFCGRAYKPSSWRWIFQAKPRGYLGLGLPRDIKGRFLKADVGIIKPADVNWVTEDEAFFPTLKDRLFLTIGNWLGHKWITPEELGSFIKGLYCDVIGFRVYDFGPGFVEPRVKRDKATPVWYPKIKLVKSDVEYSIWR